LRSSSETSLNLRTALFLCFLHTKKQFAGILIHIPPPVVICCINLGDISLGEMSFHQLLHGEPAPETEETDEETDSEETAILRLAENSSAKPSGVSAE